MKTAGLSLVQVRRYLVLFACAAGAFLTAGCSQASEPEPLNINLGTLLPTEWKPVGGLQPINIDNDLEGEWLLFYTYDSSQNRSGQIAAGPLGGVIYDPQTPETTPLEGSDPSLAPSASLKPYRLLPSYWKGAGYGFIAPPYQAETVQYLPVTRNRADEIISRMEIPDGETVAPPPNDELIVFSGQTPVGLPTHISLFWWSGPTFGYGTTQVSAPGGLVIERWTGDPESSPIERLTGLFPEHDRSVLCKRSVFERRLDPDFTPRSAYRPAVFYIEGPRVLTFCYGLPETPFYPEAAVLAYLLGPDAYADSVQRDQQAVIPRQLGDYDWVKSLQYRATVGEFESPVEGETTAQELTTTVWVTLAYLEGERIEERLYAFTLRHHPSSLQSRSTDRWQIVRVQRQG